MSEQVKPLLTQEEVNNLQLGTKVTIIWSGGNGPFNYTIQDKCGELSLVSKFNKNAGWFYGQIDNVGEHPLTQVWLRHKKES
jgi:hypothetical protein